MQKLRKLCDSDARTAVFSGCTALRILLLPANPPVIYTGTSPQGYFPGTSGGPQLVIHVGTGVGNYTDPSGWGVNANTRDGNDNANVFGGSHKAILIAP
jgi:hypothetical protein